MSMKHIKVNSSFFIYAMILFMYGCISHTETPVTPPNEGGISEIRSEKNAHIKSLIADTGVEWAGEIESVITRGAIQNSLALDGGR